MARRRSKKTTKKTRSSIKQTNKQTVTVKINNPNRSSKRSTSSKRSNSSNQDPRMFSAPTILQTGGLRPDPEANQMISRLDELVTRQAQLYAQSHQDTMNELRRLKIDREGIRLASQNPNLVAVEQFAASLGKADPQGTNPVIQVPATPTVKTEDFGGNNEVHPAQDFSREGQDRKVEMMKKKSFADAQTGSELTYKERGIQGEPETKVKDYRELKEYIDSKEKIAPTTKWSEDGLPYTVWKKAFETGSKDPIYIGRMEDKAREKSVKAIVDSAFKGIEKRLG